MSGYISIKVAPERRRGIVVGSLGHRILLALRAPGGMTYSQLKARFGAHVSTAMSQIRKEGLIFEQEGATSAPVLLSEKGREVVSPDGPLARRKTLNTYCQL